LSVGSLYEHRSTGDTNLILICLDTLRADHMKCHGYWRSTSPFMDGLAEQGVRFARCDSQAPWTGPSLFSVVTGQYPACGWDGYWTQGGLKWRQNRDAVTIAHHLSARGFNTMAVTGGGVAGPEYGLASGFNAFESDPQGKMPEVYDRVVGWLETHRQEKFFLFFHTYEIHEPYLRRFFSGGPRNIRVEAIRNYDSGIRFADGYVRRFYGKLDEWGLLANTLVVIFSDHGEDFDEVDTHGPGGPHGHHGWLLRESCLHVPLILVGPGVPKGLVVEEPVALMDLGPTVLELMGVGPLPEMDGVSLAAMIQGEEAEAPNTPLYSEGLRWGSERKALREGRWRVVYKPPPEEIAHSALPGRPFDLRWERRFDEMGLHDLTTDPEQNVNLGPRAERQPLQPTAGDCQAHAGQAEGDRAPKRGDGPSKRDDIRGAVRPLARGRSGR
jgi:arylsulfatase A-like enzyme